MSDTSRTYDRYQRSPESKAFYNSAAWKRARDLKALTNPTCERCGLVVGDIVHHIVELEQCTPEQKLAQSNLKHVCRSCHNEEHAELRAAPATPFISGQIVAVEDDDYRYDERRGTAVERFSLRFCKHWRGSLAGKPFALDPIQLAILRPVYGLVSRIDGRRRFRSLWLESGVGSGKTPLMAICGLEHLLGNAEPGAQIYSISNAFGQAKHTFEAAKTFIKNDDSLTSLVRRGALKVSEFEIYYKPTDSRWHITSGKGNKAGGAASLILADEIHQIDNRDLYDDLQGRQSKREQPLIICATNAAKRPQSLYADLHEEAAHTLTGGKRANRRLFPVIWAAPPEADASNPESWKLANRLIGVTIAEDDVADEWRRSEGSPALEARFRLMYLGQQVSEVTRWINLDRWDDATARPWPDEAKLAKMPRYLGIDWSLGDDLSSLVYIYVAPEAVYVSGKHWITSVKANHYREKYDIRYDQFIADGDLTLVTKPTIDSTVQAEVAAMIVAEHKAHPFTKVCYDRAYSDHLIAALDAARVPLEKIGQGWGVSSGCKTLENHLKAGTVVIKPSAVMRFAASNVEVKHDEHGSFWPIKPGASGKNAGKPEMKIDPISALVTGMTVARAHDFPKMRKVSTAGALLI